MVGTRREEESYADPSTSGSPEVYSGSVSVCMGHYEKPSYNYNVPILDLWAGRETVGPGKKHPYFEYLSALLARDGERTGR